jgi:hypothetical protein
MNIIRTKIESELGIINTPAMSVGQAIPITKTVRQISEKRPVCVNRFGDNFKAFLKTGEIIRLPYPSSWLWEGR